MDYQRFVDFVNAACAVLCVVRNDDGELVDIRVVCRNAAMAEKMGKRFFPGQRYIEDGMRNLRLEEFCLLAAFQGQNIHDYTYLNSLSSMSEIILIPLERESETVGYCQCIFEPVGADARRLAKVSPEAGAAVINACVTLMGAEDFKSSVERVLLDMREATEAWCCRIVLTDEDRKTVQTLCESVRPEFLAEGKRFELIEDYNETVGIPRTVIVTREPELQVLKKHNPIWAERMKRLGIRSVLILPLQRNQSQIGFLYIVNFNVERILEIKETAELIGYFLGTQISNQILVDRLEELSYTDGLTGLNNRHSMLRRVHALQSDQRISSFGIINLDLNGLKLVNDTEGHVAGDKLLIKAAEALSKVFYSDDVYRTGGDEFVVIASNIDRETFQRKLDRLNTSIEKDPEISFAVGALWSDGSMDVTEAFRAADKRMYEDKEAYYARHPELRRR